MKFSILHDCGRALLVAGAFVSLWNSDAHAETEPLKTYPTNTQEPLEKIWSSDALFGKPKIYPDTETGLAGTAEIKPIFYDGVPYEGKPTRVFAWLGMPAKHNGKVPGVVLVHGGGGTAFRDWVQAWVNRGYAAIAMDLTGSRPEVPEGVTMKAVKHSFSPKQFVHGGFSDIDAPLSDQWFYHAVAAITRAGTILASQPEVDPNRIGVTGSSWGGVLTILATGVDGRFKFSAPVYGCGFLGENSSWLERVMQDMPPERAEKWVRLWDPARYVGRNKTPLLFCNGTNDLHFRPDSWQKTYQVANAPVTLSMKVRMGHGHYPDGDPKEITIFANSITQKGEPLAEIVKQTASNGRAEIEYKNSKEFPVSKVEFNYTTDEGDWVKRRWMTKPADLDASGKKASAVVPSGVTAYYFNVIDTRGTYVSSPHVALEKTAKKDDHASVTTVKWESPKLISGDDDVQTQGNSVAAYYLSGNQGRVIAVNGVEFTSLPSNDPTVLSQEGATGYTIGRPSDLNAPPFAALSEDYKSILKGYWYGASGADIALMFSGLKPNTRYLLQLWVSDSQQVHRQVSTAFTVGTDTSEELDPNDTNEAGGVGMWVTGTFTTGPDQDALALATGAGGNINALQLRELP